MCPPNIEDQCSSNSPIPCPYITSVERAANTLGLSPPEQTTGHGGQLMRHTFLIVAYVLSMFLVSFTTFGSVWFIHSKYLLTF